MHGLRAAWSQVYGARSWQGIIQEYEGPGDRWSAAAKWECKHRHTSRETAKACAQRRLTRATEAAFEAGRK